jgi:hypothetical protein
MSPRKKKREFSARELDLRADRFNKELLGTTREQADLLVCIRYQGELQMEDNCIGHCSGCRLEIQYRPVNAGIRRKLCVDCALTLAKGEKLQ